MKILARGYGIIYKEENRVKNVTQLTVNDKVTIRLQDGEAKAKIIQE